MKKTAFILMVLTVLSKIIGFARELTLSYFYGASSITDAYLISITIPSVIFGFIGVGIGTGFIPMYSKIEQIEGSEKANRYTNNLINILMLLCAILFVFGLIFARPLVRVFARGFEGETLELAIKFTKISLMGIFFTVMIHVFNGYLQLKDNYVVPALMGFPMNFFTILFIILSSGGNINLLAIGTVVAAASQVIILLPFAYKKGYKYKPVFNIRDKHIRKMVYIALPVIMGASVNQINVLVDRSIASGVASGGITALNYANKINDFVQGIFVVSITTALYPMISKMAAENNIDGLKDSVSEAISATNLLLVPATVGAMIFAEPVVALLFGRGQFDARALSMTSTALFYYAVGMVAFGLRAVLARAFYAVQDTKTPAINAAIAVVLNIVLNIILSRLMGIGGLALATSISAVFGVILLFFSYRKKLGAFGMKNMLISFVKIVASSLIMGILARLTFKLAINNLSQNLSLIISIALGFLVYLVSIYLMKVEEIEVIINMVKGKIESK